MAHYAFLNEDNIVTEVIVGIDETELIEGKTPEVWYGEFRGQTCIRTSYNGSIRNKFAAIGDSYNVEIDAFISPKPFDSWSFNAETLKWESPVPRPDGNFIWNEELTSWVEVEI